MKTFKQFREGYMGPAVTPKNYEPKDTIIRTTDVKMKSAEKFRKGTGFNLPIPITKKKPAIKRKILIKINTTHLFELNSTILCAND